MKKLLAFILCLITSLSLTSECIANSESVSGLDDKICKLFIKNNFTEAEITEINQR